VIPQMFAVSWVPADNIAIPQGVTSSCRMSLGRFE
jgi:hypothetical protein